MGDLTVACLNEEKFILFASGLPSRKSSKMV